MASGRIAHDVFVLVEPVLFSHLRKKKVWYAYTDNLLLVRDQAMANGMYILSAEPRSAFNPNLPSPAKATV